MAVSTGIAHTAPPCAAMTLGRPWARPRARALFDEADCTAIASAVLDLRPHWLDRHPLAPFYTLGAAAYLDMPQGRDVYEARAAAANPVLDRQFATWHGRLCQGLAALLATPVALDPDARHARPGFHIYRASPFFAFDVASIHTDQQHRLLDWPDGVAPGDDAVLTFTVPIVQPPGAGLRLWSDGTGNEPCEIAYRPGELVVHDGLTPHQAVLMPQVAGDRITLQGHAVLTGGTWRLYW